MSRTLTRSIAKAVIIVSLGGIVVGNLAVNVVPSKKPPYAVMAKQRAEKDGVWVEGFMSIPLTADERLDNKIANKFAEAMLRLRGFGAPQTQAEPVAVNPIDDNFDDVETETSKEAVGAGAKGTK